MLRPSQQTKILQQSAACSVVPDGKLSTSPLKVPSSLKDQSPDPPEDDFRTEPLPSPPSAAEVLKNLNCNHSIVLRRWLIPPDLNRAEAATF